ncbi:DUF559 domain-containing protein [Ilumatobacter coccineus]|uniref:DUF559 domain-containing protein n=1 Tax=Ilumatobacter coccineus TaxID=467094 RepID=UPI00059CD21D|nr:DUF559 domain-containing protein [Ilumatobacter coccineus]
MELKSLDPLARRQHGVVTLRQSGLSKSAWYRAIASGTLIPLHPGVVRLVGTPDTPEQRIAAATAAAGDRSLASHRSAAHLHGIPGFDSAPVDIIVPHDEHNPSRARTAPRLAGVDVHRPRDLVRLAPHRIDGIRCTNVLRTLLDLGAVDRPAVSGAVGHAITNDLATLDALETVVVEHARPGRSGITALRDAIDDWAIDQMPADSVLEPAMARLIGRFELPPVVFHPVIAGREVDFRIIGTPIILECDGWAYHGLQRDNFESDRERDAGFTALGWIVLRFTYRAITSRPATVAERIRATVDRWGGLPSPDAA